jgi:hypothetical protein
MLPTQQRFEADHAMTLNRHDRLIAQPQLVALDAAPQVGLELQALDRIVVHGGVEDGVAIAAG